MADSLHIVDMQGDLTLANVAIDTSGDAAEARVGMLVDGAIGENGIVLFEGVSIDGDDGLGLRLQAGAEEAADWEIDVAAPLAANDAAFTGADLEVANEVGDGPSASAIGENGFVGEGGLLDEDGELGTNGAIGENGIIGPESE